MFNVPWGEYVPDLWEGLLNTLELTAFGFLGAIVVGILLAVARTSRIWVVRTPAYLVTETFKNLPIITGLFIVYFGLTAIGLVLDAFVSGVLCLALFYGAYLAEVFRGGLQGVPPGQREAAEALGFSAFRVLVSVQIPQAVRLALPSTATIFVDLLKGTSLLVTIGGGELMTQATLITADTFRAFEVYLVIGLIYLALCWPLSRLSGVLERMLQRGTAIAPTSRKVRRIARVQLAGTGVPLETVAPTASAPTATSGLAAEAVDDHIETTEVTR